MRPGVGRRPRPRFGWRSGERPRRSGDLARRSGERLFGEEERSDTAEGESDTAETDAEFLASQSVSACVDMAAAVSWFAAARWSRMEAG
ncbi:MAG: hypothetical protein ACK559_24445, partial [bacterium]